LDEETVAPGPPDLIKHAFAAIPAPRCDDDLGALAGETQSRRRAET
jgi:hypothetical protein